MGIRYKNRRTGVAYRYVDILEFMPWLMRCKTFDGRVQFVGIANLVRR